MSDEPELTPEIARSLFRRPEPEAASAPERPEHTEPETPAAPAAPREQQAETTDLTEDQVELATRYGLLPQEVRRVRGQTWAEKCADAERLAAIVKAQPNRGEIAALAAHKKNQHQALIELLHPSKPKGDEQA
jgi:hypothetical protein